MKDFVLKAVQVLFRLPKMASICQKFMNLQIEKLIKVWAFICFHDILDQFLNLKINYFEVGLIYCQLGKM